VTKLLVVALLALCAACARRPMAGQPLPIEDFDSTWVEGRWAFSNGAEFPGPRERRQSGFLGVGVSSQTVAVPSKLAAASRLLSGEKASLQTSPLCA